MLVGPIDVTIEGDRLAIDGGLDVGKARLDFLLALHKVYAGGWCVKKDFRLEEKVKRINLTFQV